MRPLRHLQTTLALTGALLLTACATKPRPFTQPESSAFAANRLARVTVAQEPIRDPVSLHEAMARALKYNLDTKVEVAQTALKIKELDLSDYKMLPSIVANSGFAGRDSTQASSSRSIETGRQSVEPSRSSDLQNLNGDLTLSWNVLDFGLSYVRAQQLGDEVLIAAEARRKVANRVIEDVRTAYWRAVTYQRLITRLRGLESRAMRARQSARTLYKEGQTPPMVALAYERELVEVRREIQKVEGDLLVAKSQLAALMNIEPQTQFSLVDARSGLGLSLNVPPQRLARMALENRPEMREVAYRLRINEQEMTAALLELLPGAQLYLGGNVDSNRFLLNNNWLGYGAKASWNLMKIIQLPARRQMIQSQEKLLDERSLALTMAIITQVHVSRARYEHARREVLTNADYLNVQNDILAQVRAQAVTDKTSEQSLIREEMNALLAEVRFDVAHAQLQNAFASVYASLGLDMVDHTVDVEADIKTMAAAIQKIWIKRGETVGTKASSLIRPPRTPKPQPKTSQSVPLPAFGAMSIRPPMPAPGGVSRSFGGTFLTPIPPGEPVTTQSTPDNKPVTPPASTPEILAPKPATP